MLLHGKKRKHKHEKNTITRYHSNLYTTIIDWM